MAALSPGPARFSGLLFCQPGLLKPLVKGRPAAFPTRTRVMPVPIWVAQALPYLGIALVLRGASHEAPLGGDLLRKPCNL